MANVANDKVSHQEPSSITGYPAKLRRQSRVFSYDSFVLPQPNTRKLIPLQEDDVIINISNVNFGGGSDESSVTISSNTPEVLVKKAHLPHEKRIRVNQHIRKKANEFHIPPMPQAPRKRIKLESKALSNQNLNVKVRLFQDVTDGL